MTHQEYIEAVWRLSSQLQAVQAEYAIANRDAVAFNGVRIQGATRLPLPAQAYNEINALAAALHELVGNRKADLNGNQTTGYS